MLESFKNVTRIRTNADLEPEIPYKQMKTSPFVNINIFPTADMKSNIAGAL